jgi:hypothetical protein
MRCGRVTFLAAAIAVSVVQGCATTPDGRMGQARVELSELLRAVQQEIKEAEAVPVPEPAPGVKPLRLKEVTVTVAATLTTKGAGKADVVIFPISVGGSASRAATHSFTVKLLPPPPRAGVQTLASLKEFAHAVYRIKAELQSGVTGGFAPSALIAHLKFVYTAEVGGGVNLKPIPIGVSGSVEDISTHKLELVFNAER